jgi:hypothetical protein
MKGATSQNRSSLNEESPSTSVLALDRYKLTTLPTRR